VATAPPEPIQPADGDTHDGKMCTLKHYNGILHDTKRVHQDATATHKTLQQRPGRVCCGGCAGCHAVQRRMLPKRRRSQTIALPPLGQPVFDAIMQNVLRPQQLG
jgi:hypothetical protein